MISRNKPLFAVLREANWLFLALALSPAAALADRTARYDPICTHMTQALTSISPAKSSEGTYFLVSIPREILLINFHEPSERTKEWLAVWRQYADVFDYRVEEVGPSLPPSLRKKLPPGHLRLAQTELAAGNIVVAEKIVRLGLTAKQGGISVGTSVFPPRQHGAQVSFSKVMPMRGLVVLSGKKPQNTRQGVSGLTADDDFLASSPEHPVIQAMVENLSSNIASLRIDGLDVSQAYLVGHVFLTRALAGSFTVLPRLYAASLNLIDQE